MAVASVVVQSTPMECHSLERLVFQGALRSRRSEIFFLDICPKAMKYVVSHL